MSSAHAYQAQQVTGEFQPLGVYTATTDADYVVPADASLVFWNVPTQSSGQGLDFSLVPDGSNVTIYVIDSNGDVVTDLTGGSFTLSDAAGGQPSVATVKVHSFPTGLTQLVTGTAGQRNIGTSGATVALNDANITRSGTLTQTANLLVNGGTGKLNVNSGSNVADDLITIYPGLATIGVQAGLFKFVAGAAVRHGFFTSTGETFDVSSAGIRVGVGGAVGGRIDAILVGTATWDPGSTPTGTVATTTLTVTGAAIGDVAIPSWEDTTADWIVTAFVSAANTVTVNALFMGAVSDDPGSFTLRAWVIKR